MKLNELKVLIKEELKRILKENQPATAPSKPAEKPGVKEPPAKSPGKPKPRRPFEPKPGANPNPKAQGKMNENEKKIVDDIVKRFRDKSKNNVDERKEMSPIQIQRLKKISNRLNKNNTSDSLSGSDMANFTNSLKDKYNPIKKSDMPLDKYLASKSKKETNEMLTLGNLKPSDKKAKPAYTDAEIKAMSVDQAKAALKKGFWDVPHNAGIGAKLKKKIKDAEEAKNKK
jgi:hypothetical protein